MPDWPVIESVTEYETAWYTGGYDLVEQPDGSAKRYFWASLPPAVVVVPLLDGEVVFVEQYRPTVGVRYLELPAGIVEADETYEAAAVRELAEETGYEAAETALLQRVDVATGVLRHERGLVVADGLIPGEPDRGANEFIEVTTRPVEAAVETARRRPCNDATLEGLLVAQADGWL